MNIPLLKIGMSRTAAVELHPRTAARFNLSSGQKIAVRFSERTVHASVRVNKRLPRGSLYLPNRLWRSLRMPGLKQINTCRVKSAKNVLHLGPVIGILAGKKRLDLRKRSLYGGHDILHTVWDVRRVGGLVYFFAADDINWTNRTVKGFLHIPNKVHWQLGTFPFPGAVYRRLTIPTRLFRKIKNNMTRNIFDTPNNKLQQSAVLQGKYRLRVHLPKTHPLSKQALNRMLNRFGRVYVKCTSRGSGRGVFVVKKRLGQTKPYKYVIRTRKLQQWKNKGQEIIAVRAGYSNLIKFMSKKVGTPIDRKHWLVQQPIEKAKYRGLPFDIRINLQKNGQGRWVATSKKAKIAPRSSSVITQMGSYRHLRTVLKEIWPSKWHLIEADIVNLCVNCCQVFEQRFGLLGDVGLDIALDSNGKPWFLEANPKPGYILHREDKVLQREYWMIVSRPVRFCSYLCGFPTKG